MQRVPALYPDLSQFYTSDDMSIPYPSSSTGHELLTHTIPSLSQPFADVLLGVEPLINTELEVRTILAPTRLAVPRPALSRSTPSSPTFPRPAPPTPVQRMQTPSSLSITSSSKPPIPPRRNIKMALVNETKTPIPTMDSMVGHSSVSTLSLQQMDFLSMNNLDTNKSAEIPVVISAVTSQPVSSSIAPDEEVSSERIKKILLKRRDEFMANAVAAMKAGDEENANIYLEIVMMFNEAIKVAKEVKLDEDVLNDIPKTPSPYRKSSNTASSRFFPSQQKIIKKCRKCTCTNCPSTSQQDEYNENGSSSSSNLTNQEKKKRVFKRILINIGRIVAIQVALAALGIPPLIIM